MKKTAFIVDSSSGIMNKQYQDVYVLSLIVTVGANSTIKTYKDQEEISPKEVCELINQDKDVKTSQASFGEIISLIERIYDQYDQIFVLPIPSKLSSSYNSWRMISEDYPKVKVFDNKDVSVGTRWTIEHLLELGKKKELNEQVIQSYLDEIKERRFGILFVYDLKHLKKGGRVNNVKSALASWLGLKIAIFLDDRGLNLFSSFKTFNKGLIESIKDFSNRHPSFDIKKVSKLGIINTTESLNDNDVNETIEHLKTLVNIKDIKQAKVEMPGVITTHTGPKIFAIYFEANK